MKLPSLQISSEISNRSELSMAAANAHSETQTHELRIPVDRIKSNQYNTQQYKFFTKLPSNWQVFTLTIYTK